MSSKIILEIVLDINLKRIFISSFAFIWYTQNLPKKWHILRVVQIQNGRLSLRKCLSLFPKYHSPNAKSKEILFHITKIIKREPWVVKGLQYILGGRWAVYLRKDPWNNNGSLNVKLMWTVCSWWFILQTGSDILAFSQVQWLLFSCWNSSLAFIGKLAYFNKCWIQKKKKKSVEKLGMQELKFNNLHRNVPCLKEFTCIS